MTEPQLTILENIVQGHERAQSARESFVAFVRFAGRARDGSKLRLDPPIIKTAEDAERAFREGHDFVDEQARGTLKSTIAVLFHAWLIGNHPNISVGHFSNRDEEAEDRNCWVQEVMQSPEYKAVFGKESWLVQSGKYKCVKSRTVVRGKVNKTVPNIQAKGIESARAGPHFDRGWFDDVCDEKNSIVMAAKKRHIVNLYFNTVEKMIEDPQLGHRLGRIGVGYNYHSGTPYADDDVWAMWVQHARAHPDDGPMKGVVYRRLACGGPPDFFTPVPNVITSETLADRYSRNERAYRMAYMLEPLGEGERPFTEIRFWVSEKFKPCADLVRDLGYSPVQLPRSQADPETRTWPTVMAVDPGFSEGRSASYTAFVVGLLGSNSIIYILYAARFKKSWDKAREYILAIAKKYHADRLVIESGAQQSALQSYFREQGLPFVEGISPSNISKFVRAMDVSGEVNSGRVVLPGCALKTGKGGQAKWIMLPARQGAYGNMVVLHEHLAACGAIEHMDLVDAFVYCVQALRGGNIPLGETRERTEPSLFQRRLAHLSTKTFGAEEKQGDNQLWAVFGGGGDTWTN